MQQSAVQSPPLSSLHVFHDSSSRCSTILHCQQLTLTILFLLHWLIYFFPLLCVWMCICVYVLMCCICVYAYMCMFLCHINRACNRSPASEGQLPNPEIDFSDFLNAIKMGQGTEKKVLNAQTMKSEHWLRTDKLKSVYGPSSGCSIS